MKKGFTLIELLIVVAIIAILAAIAVPNFLEAQTRSKVTRAKADMRSLATALEAYAVDRNKYPLDITGTDGYSDGAGFFWYTPNWITSPVAYISSNTIVDPFRDKAASLGSLPANIYGRFRYANYGRAERYLTSPPSGAVDGQDYLMGRVPYGSWRLSSAGPDSGAGPWPPSTGAVVHFPQALLLYDATNGTVSFGDIVRSQKDPEGPFVNF